MKNGLTKMIAKETNKYLREIECPFCGYKYDDSEMIEPLGNTDFTKKVCILCRETFFWKREITTEYKIAIE